MNNPNHQAEEAAFNYAQQFENGSWEQSYKGQGFHAGYLAALTAPGDGRNGEREARIKQLEDAIRTEQTGLAQALSDILQTVDGYSWVTEGRGPYAYNDDEYKAEMGRMLEAVKNIAKPALNKAGLDATNVLNNRLRELPSNGEREGEVQRLREVLKNVMSKIEQVIPKTVNADNETHMALYHSLHEIKLALTK